MHTILFAMARFAALVSAYVSASAVKHDCEQYARARSSESTTFALSSNLTTVSHVWHSKSARTCSLDQWFTLAMGISFIWITLSPKLSGMSAASRLVAVMRVSFFPAAQMMTFARSLWSVFS